MGISLRPVTSRAFSLAGAAAFVVVAALCLPALAHPSELYGPGGNPCSAHTLRDAIAYGVLAGFTMAAALAAWTLLTRRRPIWLASVGVGLLLVGLATKRTSNFGCLSNAITLSSDHGHPWLAVALAAAATVGVLLVWLRVARAGDQTEP